MIGFVLDGVKDFRNLDSVDTLNFDKFTVYQDPVYYKFTEEGMVKEFHYAERKYLEIRVSIIVVIFPGACIQNLKTDKWKKKLL